MPSPIERMVCSYCGEHIETSSTGLDEFVVKSNVTAETRDERLQYRQGDWWMVSMAGADWIRCKWWREEYKDDDESEWTLVFLRCGDCRKLEKMKYRHAQADHDQTLQIKAHADRLRAELSRKRFSGAAALRAREAELGFHMKTHALCMEALHEAKLKRARLEDSSKGACREHEVMEAALARDLGSQS